ncbi:uncharacterized protein PV09_05079 [Verruconis gallopava]|uniref:Cutinase n=1 Tax=Verruconis gallopava TaxID=253628 RepID=A0A0D1XML3_9PEZI|nr:uncharacterized protein PV09_05079 [Verruconis gallopava]KIW03776.1 hypothetical protein PV09_05079 [Verruconis gallopava]
MMRSLFTSMVVTCAAATANLEPAAQPAAVHEFERRYTDAQIHNTSSSTACAKVHVIVDRATGEPPSQGVIGTLATIIATRIPGTTVEWVDYPAVLVPYDQSTNTGITMTKDSITSYADKCPNAKIVMLGYSQGAQVVGDVLCGGGGALGLGPYTDPLEENYVKRIAAAVQMGDPRFVPGMPWDRGTAVTGGIFPRQPNQTCERVASILVSYCDANDPFCAVPGFDYNVHATYDIRYNEDAFNFVEGKINGSTTGKKGDSTRQSPRSSASLLALAMLFVFSSVL